MPLLKKKAFVKAPIPDGIHDDEEVFYCAATNEIFRNYEEFSERMFLCNSMVWTCSLTGKTNLTYAEALESERNAKNSLKDFPAELKIPILYLASRTRRTAFNDMADDVFLFAKDKFFIGENIETSFTETKWKDSHVLQVIAPALDEIKALQNNGSTEDKHSYLPASCYKYEIEHLDADDSDISEIMIVDCGQMRRKKGIFSRERCKLFLKQYVEQDARGTFVVKPSAVENFKLDAVNFNQMFAGPPPEFGTSKKLGKVMNGKKTRQESLHKFLTKNGEFVKNGNLLEKMRMKEEEFRLIKQQKKERELEMKQKRKEENILLAGKLKDWYKPKEDLELVDQKELPETTAVKLKVSDEHVGDMFMILEFVNTFSKLLSTKDFFPSGLTIELMERALTEHEIAGPLLDLIQMLLIALFNVQDEEASQYRTETENPSYIKQEDNSNNINLREATRLATIASQWSKKYQGLPLGQLPLYSLTTSEILRLHLLSSGAIINSTGARWRYQERGGYTSEDDPGLYLRVHDPHILKALKVHNVVELPISDKLKILSCLVNQLLTYADVRDVVEERMEKIKQAKADYKMTLAAERKREQEFLTARYKLKKAAKTDPKFADELEKLEAEAERKKAENDRRLEELKKIFYDRQVVMGQDRAFRQYLRLESIPGLFVNFEEGNSGSCLSHAVEQFPHLVNASRDELLSYIKTTIKESNSSDKENSPSKNLKKINGSFNGVKEQKSALCDELMMCSANPETCVVHSFSQKNDKWSFYRDGETFSRLLDGLNKRGVRENELQQTLKSNKEEIEKVIADTPVSYLNVDLESGEQERRRSKSVKAKYENANLGYSNDMSSADIFHNALIENILEMEEKIHVGSLGALHIKDREKWRSCIQNKNYKELDKTLIKPHAEKEQQSSNSDRNAESPVNSNLESQDSDLEQYSNAEPDCMSDIDNNDVILVHKEEIREAIQNLSVALAQVAQAVYRKCLKKPLGRMGGARNQIKKENMLPQWEQSLLMSTSFSQIFLHYSTLDSCVMWGKSVLLTRCRICRRRNDAENMLLCNACNLGHHLYCLKPKLKSIPTGDWFCNRCQKDREREKKIEVCEPPRKKRPIFGDEDTGEEVCVEERHEQGDNSESEEVDDDDDDDDDDEEQEDEIITTKIELCKACSSGGELVCCEKCANNYHIECVAPPLRRAPRGPWLCNVCKKNNERKRHYDSSHVNGVRKSNGQRRCAAKALYKIHDFAKSLQQLSESDDSSEEEVISRRTTRRDDGRVDLPLHNSALHAVLSEIMKDYNAWPFLRPVQKTEVPDYYDVITKPMDFGTIKYKLNMGEYKEDAQFMSDALLVFQNCNTYNHSDDDVYKCGVELLKHFQKKCRELGLKLPEEMNSDASDRPKKKIRTK